LNEFIGRMRRGIKVTHNKRNPWVIL